MSSIINNLSALGSNAPSTSPGFERSTTPGFALPAPALREHPDAISLPWTRPIVSSGGGFGAPNASNGSPAFGDLMNGFMNAISNLFSQLATMFNLSSGSSTQQQTHFQNASAGSVGDPHESFDGTTGTGAKVGGKWDDMQSHENLLRSDSFDGGYHVSTNATPPDARGATLNDRASVTTDGGHTSVLVNKDGSYDVSSFGREVALRTGEAVHVSAGETVTLNADRSLTVDDRNGRNGSISTTLRSNGAGGVDVTATAKNVDLGGYLIDKSDGDDDLYPRSSPYGNAGAAYGTGAYEGTDPVNMLDFGPPSDGQPTNAHPSHPSEPIQYAGEDVLHGDVKLA